MEPGVLRLGVAAWHPPRTGVDLFILEVVQWSSYQFPHWCCYSEGSCTALECVQDLGRNPHHGEVIQQSWALITQTFSPFLPVGGSSTPTVCIEDLGKIFARTWRSTGNINEPSQEGSSADLRKQCCSPPRMVAVLSFTLIRSGSLSVCGCGSVGMGGKMFLPYRNGRMESCAEKISARCGWLCLLDMDGCG